MKVLVVGSGAREHALAWKLATSPSVSAVYCAPGNAGSAMLAHTVPIAADNRTELVVWARREEIDLVVVGPEAPLAGGLADACEEANLKVFGPRASAAVIEASKVWAKGFMERQAIPTARAISSEKHADAIQALAEFDYPVVIKADGLAAGKGVEIARSEDEARTVLDRFMARSELGSAGQRVVLEEYLQGAELSVFALHDGRDVVLLPPVRDYKRLLDGDTGPNTGGMGGYTPVGETDGGVLEIVRSRIIEPTLSGMEQEGRPFRGVLYAGLMLTEQGPKVLEFNCRFGDPETQVLMPLLESDLAEVLLAVAKGTLSDASVRWSPRASCGVVLASQGYPGKYRIGVPVYGLDELDEGTFAFHGGTARRSMTRAPGRWSSIAQGMAFGGANADLVTAGGRVLTVVSTGSTLEEARRRAYAGATSVSFEGVQFRTDIGARADSSAAATRIRSGTGRGGNPPLGPSIEVPTSETPSGTDAAQTRAGLGRVLIVYSSAPQEASVEAASRALQQLGLAPQHRRIGESTDLREIVSLAETFDAGGGGILIAVAGPSLFLARALAACSNSPVLGVVVQTLEDNPSAATACMETDGGAFALAGYGLDGARNAARLASAILSLGAGDRRERYARVKSSESRDFAIEIEGSNR